MRGTGRERDSDVGTNVKMRCETSAEVADPSVSNSRRVDVETSNVPVRVVVGSGVVVHVGDAVRWATRSSVDVGLTGPVTAYEHVNDALGAKITGQAYRKSG